jgi:EmrB/QacA subfamily drug resistance transporter
MAISNSVKGGVWILAATIIGSSMVFIDGTVVNVALPVLQKEFSASLVDASWVVEAYALMLAALMLVGGSLGDRFGRKKLFALGIVVFALASIACGAAQSVQQLIVSRAMQGIGGALLTPGSLAIITASFDQESRGKAIGTWSGFSAILAGFGPVLGGWLIDHASWRWAFWINVPLAVAALVILFFKVPESRDKESAKHLDWTGATLATFGLGLLVYGLIESSNAGVSTLVCMLTIVGGVVLLVLFTIVESRSKSPMMPLALFKSKTFAGANLLTLFLYAALSGTLFFLPFNLIQVQGYATTEAGAALVPFIVIMFTLSRWSGGLVAKYGAKKPLIIGPTIAGLGFLLFAVPSIGQSYWVSFFPAVIVLGLGMAIAVAPLTTAVMGAVDQRHSGLASGINNAVSRVAALIAVAIFGVLLFHSFSNSMQDATAQMHLTSEVKANIEHHEAELAAMKTPQNVDAATKSEIKRAINESFLDGFRMVMIVAAGLAFMSSMAAWKMIEN